MVLLSAGRAEAQFLSVGDYHFSLTETLYADWHAYEAFRTEDGRDGDYQYTDIKNRLNIMVDSSAFEAGFRLDTATFLAPSGAEAAEAFNKRFDDNYTLEKVYARFRDRNFSVEVGDVYGCLGKGIALCVKKVDELSMDPTLRGGKAAFRNSLFHVTALGGTANIVNVGDKVEERLDDPDDVVMGGEMRVTPFPWVSVSGHASLVRDFDDAHGLQQTGNGRREVAVTGGMLSFPDLFGAGSLVVEFDRMTNQGIYVTGVDGLTVTSEEQGGKALYAAATADAWIFHLLGEMKWYEGFDGWGAVGKRVTSTKGPELVYYGVLPPIEDDAMFLRPEQYDVFGGRLRLDAEIPPSESVLFVSYAQFEGTEEVDLPEEGQHVRHVIVGVEQRVDRLSIVGSVSGGWRWDQDGLKHDYAMHHVEGDVHFPIWGAHSFELLGRREAYDDAMGADFSIARVASTYTYASLGSLSFVYEYSDQPGARPAGKDLFTWETTTLEHFYSMEVVARLRSDAYVKLLVGSTRGGLRCAGGVCRTFPPFEGARGELTFRF